MKRVLSILLAFVILIPFAACSDQSDLPADTTAPTQSDTQTPAETTKPAIEYEEDDLPSTLDFGGEPINILSPYINTSAGILQMPEITVEELSNEVINDSIYNRERYVEERLGVEINNIQQKKINDEIEKQFSSGDNNYQIYAVNLLTTSALCIHGYFLDLNEVEYLNLDKPWWSSLFNDEAELLGELYFTSGSLALSMLRNMNVVYYNKALADDFSKDIPELADMYAVVESGDWTFDKWLSLSENIYTDSNGNSERDGEDLYGIGYVRTTIIEAFFSSFDIDVLSRTSDGWFELNVNTDKMFTSLDKMYNLFFNTTGCYAPGTGECDLDDMEILFAGGSILFMVNDMRSVETTALRNMQDEYGILPYPKYDTNQKEYYTLSNEHMTFAIPSIIPDSSIAGAVLEAMASYSYRDTVPAYLDIAIKGKYMSDPGSRRMIDTIVNGYKPDASKIYFNVLANEYTAAYRYMLINGENSFAAKHATNSKTIERLLKYTRRDLEQQ